MGRARGSSKPLPFSEWPEEAVISPSPHGGGGGGGVLLSQLGGRGLRPDGWSTQPAAPLLVWSLIPSIFLPHSSLQDLSRTQARSCQPGLSPSNAPHCTDQI